MYYLILTDYIKISLSHIVMMTVDYNVIIIMQEHAVKPNRFKNWNPC